ncbi:MAG TPA: hypothetical protein VIJ97_02170 [Candidatus Anoxymicrobiaceae bacterium]
MGRDRQLMRCRECGFPRIVSFFIKWKDNGTITQMMRQDFRVVVLHFGFLDNLFSNIEAKLGISIEHIAFEAQRNASKATFTAFTDRIPAADFFMRPGFVKRIGVEGFNKVGKITGQCHSETLEYKPGRYGVARIRNPFNFGLMAANVVGAFETLEGVPFNHKWEEESPDSFIIRVEPTGERPEIAARMELAYSRMLPGCLVHNRCPRCKVPRGLSSHVKWMEDDGIILDTRTGSRVIMLDGYMVTTVFREMVSELGDEVNDLLVDAQREWTVDHVGQLGLAEGDGPLPPAELEKAYREYLKNMSLYGIGNPVSFEMEDSTVEVKVENPYEVHIIAGTLQGLREALEKSRSAVEWEEVSQGTVLYRVSPALESK